MTHRINVEVVYFKSNKNSCLLNKLKNIDTDVKVTRNGSKKQKRVRYTFIGFEDQEHLNNITKQIKKLLAKAPIQESKVKKI